jgi:peptide/nickel transport system permease protein
MRMKSLPIISIVLLGLIVICGVFAGLIAPYNPDVQNLAVALQHPSAQHVFGTDDLGRDTASRVVYGIRPLAVVSIVGVVLGAAFGVLIGLTAGSARGWVESALMRLADIMLSIPPIVLAVLLALLFGAGKESAIIAITLVLWPQFARIARADTVSVLASEYCDLARVAGLSRFALIRRHVVMNITNNLVVLGTLSFGTAVLVSSALSFLGLGTEPPQPDWGNMLAEGLQYPTAWWMLVFPGAALTIAVLSLNSIGDWLRDVTDPMARSRVGADDTGLLVPPADGALVAAPSRS